MEFKKSGEWIQTSDIANEIVSSDEGVGFHSQLVLASPIENLMIASTTHCCDSVRLCNQIPIRLHPQNEGFHLTSSPE